MNKVVIIVPSVVLAFLAYMIFDGFQRVTETWGPLASAGIMIAISLALFMMLMMSMFAAFTAIVMNSQANAFSKIIESNQAPIKEIFKSFGHLLTLARQADKQGKRNGLDDDAPDFMIIDNPGIPTRGQLSWADDEEQGTKMLETSSSKSGMYIAK